jgi:hypothetical protein
MARFGHGVTKVLEHRAQRGTNGIVVVDDKNASHA